MASVFSSPAQASTSAAASVRLVDVCGVVLSGLCAVHCAVTPVLVGVLPAVAGEGAETGLRRVLITLGLFGVGFGTVFHRDRRALVPLAGGLMLAALLEVGAVVPAWEVFVSLGISGLLISAHALNTRACNAHCTACSPARFWTARVEELGASRVGSGLLAVAAAILVHAAVLAVALRVESSVSLEAEPLPTAEIEVDLFAAGSTAREGLAVVPTGAEVGAVMEPGAAPVRPSAPERGVDATPPPKVPSEAAPVAFDDVLAAPLGAAPSAHTPSPGTPSPGRAAPPTAFDEAIGVAGTSGNGASASGRPSGRVGSTGRDSAGGGVAGGGPAMGALAGSSELARAPTQPAGLGARIEAHYPTSARLQGVGGVGRARLLVSSEGVVVQAAPLSETPNSSGFANACVNALSGSRGWGLPLDASGRPVSTWIRFSCEFAVRH